MNIIKIRMAVVGWGRISNDHFESIKQHASNIELVSICDVDNSVLSKFINEHNINRYVHLWRDA